MRTSMKLCGLAALVLAGWMPGAGAQSNPSSEDIIKSLRPGAGFSSGTRGIHPTIQPQDEAPAATPAVPAPQHAGGTVRRPAAPATNAGAQAAAPSVNLNVQFASGSSDITAAAAHTLNALGSALSSAALSGSHFRIEGHTDTVGNPETNKDLSARRAAAVVDYLVEHFHIARGRLDPVGMGEEGLLIATPAQHPELRNRRVQVVNTSA